MFSDRPEHYETTVLGEKIGLYGYNGAGDSGYEQLSANNSVVLANKVTAGFFIIQGYQNMAIAIGWFAGINTPKINFLCNFTGSPISTEKDTADKINLYIDNDSITLQNKKSATLKYRFTIIGVRDSWY